MLLGLDSGGNSVTSVGTVDITGDSTTLTYQVNLTSGTLSAVYFDVGGSVSSLVTDGSWSADTGPSATALGTFTNTRVCNSGCGTELTATFYGTNLVADYTLSGTGIQMFSAANTSDGLFGDRECESALTPSDGGLTPATLLAELSSAIVSPAYAGEHCHVGTTPAPAALPLFVSGLSIVGAFLLGGSKVLKRASAMKAA